MKKVQSFLLTPVLLAVAFGSGYGVSLANVGATAQAAVVVSEPFVYFGDASAQLITDITTGNGAVKQAYDYSNNAARMNGNLTQGDCPIRHVHLRCKVIEGVEVYDWEIRTKPTSRSKIWGEPQ